MFTRFRKPKKKIVVQSRTITVDNIVIDYTLRLNPRSKSVRLSVLSDGEVVITTPVRNLNSIVEQILIQKKDWIIEKKILSLKSKSQQRLEYLDLKEKALKIAVDKVNYWNSFYNFKFNKISIKNQQTRWGSCSKKGNLNFSYKIALIPDNLADYLVVHEISHLGEFNHSIKFWNLVSRTIPNYKELRRELKGIK